VGSNDASGAFASMRSSERRVIRYPQTHTKADGTQYKVGQAAGGQRRLWLGKGRTAKCTSLPMSGDGSDEVATRVGEPLPLELKLLLDDPGRRHSFEASVPPAVGSSAAAHPRPQPKPGQRECQALGITQILSCHCWCKG